MRGSGGIVVMIYHSTKLCDCYSTKRMSICKSHYLRRLIFLLSILFPILYLDISVHAQDNGFQSMQITFADNTNTVLPLLDSTKILVDNDSFVFQISEENVWIYKFSEIKGFSYVSASINVIEEINNDCNRNFTLDGDRLTIAAPAKIAIWRIDGIIAMPLTYIETDRIIDIRGYVSGIYLVFVNGKTFKILKK